MGVPIDGRGALSDHERRRVEVKDPNLPLYVRFIIFVLCLFRFFFFVVTIGSNPLYFEWICYFDNDADLPALESESSSVSLATYRNQIAAESEDYLYNRIRRLESEEHFCIPPQTNIGDYERLVREHFDQALNVDDYFGIWDREFAELQFLEKKALLQERLHELMINEAHIELIMELSPYSEIKKEAYFFLHDKLASLNNLEHAFQRHLMDGNLNSFIQDLNTHNRQSAIYREFYHYFTDEEYRRSLGLPLP